MKVRLYTVGAAFALFVSTAAFAAGTQQPGVVAPSDYPGQGEDCYVCRMIVYEDGCSDTFCAPPNEGAMGYDQCEVYEDPPVFSCSSYGEQCCEF